MHCEPKLTVSQGTAHKITAYKVHNVCYTAYMPWGVLLDGAQKSLLRGSRPLHLQYTTKGTFCQVAMQISHSSSTETQDTRINYSCSKASTEGCMEVALRDHYIMPITSSQWVKMFWHNLGTNNHYNQLAKHFYKSFIKSYQGSTLSSTLVFFGGLSTYLIKYVPHKVRNIGE